MAISFWCSDSNCCSIFLTTSHFSIFLFSISAAMITAPISEHLPGRLIKAPPPPGQRLGQICEDGSAADDGVTMRIVCPACLRTLAGLGHRLCHQSTGTPMDTRARAGHQYRVDSRAALSQNFRPPTKQLPMHQRHWPRPIIMEICTKNDLFGAIIMNILETRLCARSCN